MVQGQPRTGRHQRHSPAFLSDHRPRSGVAAVCRSHLLTGMRRADQPSSTSHRRCCHVGSTANRRTGAAATTPTRSHAPIGDSAQQGAPDEGQQHRGHTDRDGAEHGARNVRLADGGAHQRGERQRRDNCQERRTAAPHRRGQQDCQPGAPGSCSAVTPNGRCGQSHDLDTRWRGAPCYWRGW